MAIRNVNLWRSVDWFTIVLYFILVTCGWLSICGATYNFSETNFFDFTAFTGKHIVWIGCAALLGIVLLNIEKKYYEMMAYPLYIGFIILLAATRFLAGDDINGSYSCSLPSLPSLPQPLPWHVFSAPTASP